MSTNDKHVTSADGATEETLSQSFPAYQQRNYSHIQPLSLTSPGLNGFPQPLQQTNGGAPNPPMSPGYMQARQPINDAVASAFQTTDSSMSPDLIHLITQNVIQQIQAHNLSNVTAQPVQPPTSVPVDHNEIASNSSTSPTFDRPRVATPPSPYRQASVVNAHGYETGVRREISPVRNGYDNEKVLSDTESRMLRPEPVRRVSTDDGMTVLEKIWGRFFDEQGQSTKRLELFLRGVAVHLIQDYEPKNSLVVTPVKMQRYYEETSLSEHVEIYPWQHIFDDKTSSISRLLRESEVSVEHHLIQKAPDARPDIPGLTPHGFATWMTLLIRAHPDQEYERLLKTVREMPVNNPDTRDRFPKDLSRKLFPETGDSVLATTLAGLMSNHCKVQIHPRQASTAGSESRQSYPSPPFSARNPPAPTVEDVIDESDLSDPTPMITRTTSVVDSSGSSLRQTVSHASASTAPLPETEAEFDESDVPTPNASSIQKPLERERKPYVGSTSGGKNYDVAGSSSDERADTKKSSASEYDLRRTKSVNPSRSRPPPPIAIHQRASVIQADGPESARARSSTVNDDQGNSIHRTRSNHSHNAESQPFRRTRSNSTYANDSSTTRYHPKRSPSLSKSGFDIPRSSAPDVKGSNYQPAQSYPNNYPSGSASRPAYESRETRYRDRERERDRDRDRDRERDRDRSRDPEYDTRLSRQRTQSTVPPMEPPSYSDDYHRQPATPNTPYQYPPTAYRDSRDPRDPRDNRDPRDSRDTRDQRDPRDPRDSRV